MQTASFPLIVAGLLTLFIICWLFCYQKYAASNRAKGKKKKVEIGKKKKELFLSHNHFSLFFIFLLRVSSVKHTYVFKPFVWLFVVTCSVKRQTTNTTHSISPLCQEMNTKKKKKKIRQH